MSRLNDALKSLIGKCTPDWAKPIGDKTDDIIECISRYYIGKPYIVHLTWNADSSVISSDSGYGAAYEAFVVGRNVYAVDNLGYVWKPYCFGTNSAQFMCQRSGQNNIVKLRETAGECELVRVTFATN